MDREYTYLNCLAELGVGGAHPGGFKLTQEILSAEHIGKKTTVLDAGCGTGQTAAYVAQQYGCQVTGLDHHQLMVEKARKRVRSLGLPIQIVHGNTEALPFADSQFDLVLSESVIVFTDMPRTVQEFRRVLKPGGCLIAIEMVLEQPVSPQRLAHIKDFYGVSRILTEKQWVQLFRKAGFPSIHSEKYDLQFGIQNVPDFSLSEDVDVKYFEMLEHHMLMFESTKEILGFRVFRCKTV